MVRHLGLQSLRLRLRLLRHLLPHPLLLLCPLLLLLLLLLPLLLFLLLLLLPAARPPASSAPQRTQEMQREREDEEMTEWGACRRNGRLSEESKRKREGIEWEPGDSVG
jgi:hypothetical protein